MRSVTWSVVLVGLVGCGEAEPLSSRTDAILAGTVDSTSLETVAIMISPEVTSTGVGFCSGVRIAPNVVLTARHCVAELAGAPVCEDTDAGVAARLESVLDPSRFTVSGATRAYLALDTFRRVVGVSAVSADAGSLNCGNDLAMLQLEVAPDVTHFVPVRLEGPPVLNEMLTVKGYGANGAGAGGSRRTRSGVKVTAVGLARDTQQLRSTESDFVVDVGPCGGDSGGPALDSSGALVGVMSRGSQAMCTDMVYTQLVPHADWVRTTARAMAADGGYFPEWLFGPAVDAGIDAGVDAGVEVADAGAAKSDAVAETLGPASGCSSVGLVTPWALAVLLAWRRPRHPRRQ